MTQPAASEDAISVLETDHREVEQMFAELTALPSATAGADSARLEERKNLVDKVIMELVRHSMAEEQYLYPAVKDVLPNGTEIAEHEISEHAEAERTMNDLDGMSPDNVEFDATVRTLMTQVREHVTGEETLLFPQLRRAMTAAQLQELGEKITKAKQVAPTRPHPTAPDRPPLDKVVGAGAAVVDRIRDAITGRGKD